MTPTAYQHYVRWFWSRLLVYSLVMTGASVSIALIVMAWAS